MPTAAFLALLLAFALAACDGKTGRAVVLISLDTLRQDHLGCYGYGRDTCSLDVRDNLHGLNLIAGLEEGRWKKNHAFGVWPNGGLNHHLVRDGAKFVEARLRSLALAQRSLREK